ncbi:MAG: hypothetical protein JXR31_04525 [Prolixibacteraceae bacterium]|nr:hypothetical protein [Prolixibacteraceae bacterium]MBN2773489.1 hypothetical protein [Prolixibacteraceae bacterium]
MKLFENIYGKTPVKSIEEEKEIILHITLILLNITGIPAIIAAIAEAVQFGMSITAFLYCILFMPIVLALVFRNRLSFNQKVWMLISAAFFIGNLVMYNEAFFGATFPIYLTIIAFITLFFGLRQGIYLLLVCIISMIVFSTLFVNKIIIVPEEVKESSQNIATWVSVIISFPYLAGIIAYCIARMNNRLIANIQYNSELAENLKKTNDELINIKKNLEGLIKKRTAELEKKTEELLNSNNQLLSKNEELQEYNDLFVGREFRIKELKDKIQELEKIIKSQ